MDSWLAGTRYCSRALEVLDAALAGGDPEHDGVIDPECGSVLLYGIIAGASGVVRIHVVTGASPIGVLDAFLKGHAAVTARLIMCELPSDSVGASIAELLVGRGFALVGRIADYFAPGAGLDILVRDRAG